MNSISVLLISILLSVNPGGGFVKRTPDLPRYDFNDVVQLEAIPYSGNYFAGWTGDLEGNKNPITITMDANKVVNAYFYKIGYTLSVNTTYGYVSKVPYKPSYDLNDSVVLTAYSVSRKRFDRWTGDVSNRDRKKNPLTVIMNKNKTITANYR